MFDECRPQQEVPALVPQCLMLPSSQRKKNMKANCELRPQQRFIGVWAFSSLTKRKSKGKPAGGKMFPLHQTVSAHSPAAIERISLDQSSSFSHIYTQLRSESARQRHSKKPPTLLHGAVTEGATLGFMQQRRDACVADVQEIFGILSAELLCPTPALCGWVGVDGGRGYSVRKQRSGNET